MFDVLLINAPVENPRFDNHAGLSPPLGLAYIGGKLLEEDHSVSGIDMNISGFSEQRLENAIDRDEPGIIGISAHTETYQNGLRIANLVKTIDEDITVVMGGPHASVMHETVVQEPAIDVVVRGEGEEAMAELTYNILNEESLDNIAGITYEKGEKIQVNRERDLSKNPDELPRPARDLFPLHLYDRPGNVLLSRGGCPFQCRFCAVNNIWGNGQREFRDPKRVANEIEDILNNYDINTINFADDTFTLNRSKVEQFLNEVENIKSPRPWRWECSTRVDLVDRDLLERMFNAGCHSIQYGVEAGTDEMLDVIGKGIALKEVRKAIEDSLDVGMDVLASFMYPHPDDTEETIRRQKEFMRELHVMGANVSLSATTPYPGTYYHNNKEELEIEIHAEEWSEFDAKHLIISTKHLDFPELEAHYKELVESLRMEARSATSWS